MDCFKVLLLDFVITCLIVLAGICFNMLEIG